MHPVVSVLLEILKYITPAIIVLLAAYLIVQKFLVSQLQRKQIALLQEAQNVTIPLRLQAYERLTIFVERIHSRNLVPRVYLPGMTANELRFELIQAINAEYEHNLSQQIYVSRQVWQTVKHMKEQELALINQLAQQLPPDAPAKELQIRLADYIMTVEGELPNDIALQIINEEAKKVLSYGSGG